MDAETHALETRAVHARYATRGSPFFDVTIGGVFVEERFSDPIVVGLQGGAYLGDIVRIGIRLEMPSSEARDQASTSYDDVTNGSGYVTNSSPAKLLYGGSLGVTVINTENFAFSPGLAVLRADESDYGTVLGINLPFEWVTSRGLRFGLEANLGRAFGGTVHYACTFGNCTGTSFDRDREAGRALGLRFTLGYGFGYYKRP